LTPAVKARLVAGDLIRVRRAFTVRLAQLQPVNGVPAKAGYPTIGAFYDAISKAVARLSPADFLKTRQRTVVHGMTLPRIDTQDQALAAIEKIKEQGEGTTGSPMSGGSLAHYFRFGEMVHECHYKLKNGSWDYDPNFPLPMPTVQNQQVYPMAPIPCGGYPGVSDEFDAMYSQVVRDLESAWATDDDAAGQRLLNGAIVAMKDKLPVAARSLMQKRIVPNLPATYGPSFRYLP
jgi:hypothetical protein